MIERRSFETLRGRERGLQKSKHHFLFAGPEDRWGAIGAWNDDEFAPSAGFALHPHANMEIVTYVRRGATTHQDNLGNSGRTAAGDVQVMSTGTGIRHSEFNREFEPALVFQIWIEPTEDGGLPRWGTKPFPKGYRAGRLVVLASGFESDADALPIQVEGRVLGATLTRDQSVDYALEAGRYLYLVPAVGRVLVNGVEFDARDGAAIKDVAQVTVTAIEDSEIVLVDVPTARVESPLAA